MVRSKFVQKLRYEKFGPSGYSKQTYGEPNIQTENKQKKWLFHSEDHGVLISNFYDPNIERIHSLVWLLWLVN